MAEYDQDIINLAHHVLGQRQPKSDLPPAEPEAQPQASEIPVEARPNRNSRGKAQPQEPEIKVEARPDHADVSTGKETKTAAELAQMIETDLAKHPQCPKNGLQVTVYGATLWRAMLTIAPAAGAVRNPQEWRDLTEELAERLRRQYDLAWR